MRPILGKDQNLLRHFKKSSWSNFPLGDFGLEWIKIFFTMEFSKLVGILSFGGDLVVSRVSCCPKVMGSIPDPPNACQENLPF